MIYIEKIKIIDDTYPGAEVLKQNFEITCSDVNLFVGDQGTGKSTMLKLLQQNHSDIELKFSFKGEIESYYFDSEHDNPRTKNPELYTDVQGRNIGIGFGAAAASRFSSHGEILEQFTLGPLSKAKDCVILLDEPETALSIKNQFKFIEEIKTSVKRGCQFFMATHCYPLIEAFDVISLDHFEQMKGIDYINKFKMKKNGN